MPGNGRNGEPDQVVTLVEVDQEITIRHGRGGIVANMEEQSV